MRLDSPPTLKRHRNTGEHRNRPSNKKQTWITYWTWTESHSALTPITFW